MDTLSKKALENWIKYEDDFYKASAYTVCSKDNPVKIKYNIYQIKVDQLDQKQCYSKLNTNVIKIVISVIRHIFGMRYRKMLRELNEENVASDNHKCFELFIIDPKTFMIQKKLYRNIIYFIYDLINIDKENYFARFTCPIIKDHIIYFDKITLYRFLKLCQIYQHETRKNIFHLLSYLFQKVSFEALTTQCKYKNHLLTLEELRSHVPDIHNTFSLKINTNLISINNSIDLSTLKKSIKQIDKQEELSNIVDIQKINVLNENYVDILKTQDLGIRISSEDDEYRNYAIYLKDCSFYVYAWLYVLRYYHPFFQDMECNQKLFSKKMRRFFRCLHTLSKSIKSIYEFSFQSKILQLGIKF